MNRDERRREAFGPKGSTQDNLEPAPATSTPGHDAHTGRPDQDVTNQTGAGTGGATEDDDRIVNHEGIHLGNQPNS